MNVKKDERLEQILKHAAQVFYDKGYDRASIRDIARQADMSLAGLYYYFRSKEELLFLIQKHVFTELLRNVRSEIAAISDPVRQLEIFIANHLTYFIDNLVEMKVLSHEYECLKGDYRESITALRREYYKVAEGIVTSIVTDRQGSEVVPRIAVLGLFGMMNWLYTWYRPSVDGTAAQVAAQMSGLYLKGLTSA
jgi:TetR/AcrR family transcriptional regulator, cholesterol catabolism regulator